MHTGAVIAEDGLGHEGDGLAVLAGNILDNVLVKQKIISHAGECGEGHAHFDSDRRWPLRGDAIPSGMPAASRASMI